MASVGSGRASQLEAVPVELAVGRIKGGASIERAKTWEIIVRPGQPFRLTYRFRLDEASPKKEEYLFTLRSEVVHQRNEVPPVRVEPLSARWGDRWGLPDKADGTLQHDYRLAKAGSYLANFEVEAEYILLEWGAKKVEKRDRQIAKGSVPIQVVEPKA